MERERRKRKMDEKEAESEEQQMEKFFALIKSTKDVRDRLSKEREEEKAKGVWKPTFQPEDFMDDEELAKVNVLHHQPQPQTQPAGPSGKKTQEEAALAQNESPEPTAEPQAQNGNNKKPTHDLDLTLSL